MNEYMPKGGVNELLKSDSGRRYLQELQDRHKNEIQQPRNPDGSPNSEFQKLYGDRIKKDKALREKNEKLSKDMWAEREEIKKAPKHHTDWKKKQL